MFNLRISRWTLWTPGNIPRADTYFQQVHRGQRLYRGQNLKNAPTMRRSISNESWDKEQKKSIIWHDFWDIGGNMSRVNALLKILTQGPEVSKCSDFIDFSLSNCPCWYQYHNKIGLPYLKWDLEPQCVRICKCPL